jgi:hypothetical protein
MVIGLLSVPSNEGARALAGAHADATLPPSRTLGGLTPDPTGSVVLFGGLQSDTFLALGDTWTWDGLSWIERHPADSPSARFVFAMTYDEARRQVVLFGGEDGHTFFGDTWIWDGLTWTQLHPAHSPPPCELETMTYDAARRQIVMFSCSDEQNRNETWTWDGVDWQQVFPANSPQSRSSQGMVYDPARKRVVLFGGANICMEFTCAYSDTWLWNGFNWKKLQGIEHPTARMNGSMAYDSSSHAVVVFGGVGGPGQPQEKADTWTWTGPDWARADPVHSPLPREGAMMTRDPTASGLLLFGGRDTSGGFYRDFQDTWTWDGTDWTCVSMRRLVG